MLTIGERRPLAAIVNAAERLRCEPVPMNIPSDTRIPPARLRLVLEKTAADPALHPAVRAEADYALWEVCLASGDRDAALAYLDRAIAIAPLRTRRPPDAVPVRSLLRLAVPGDFQTNLPIEMLLDGTTLLHTFFVGDPEAVLADPGRCAATMPQTDAVLIGIAEDRRFLRHLRAADALARALGRRVVNNGERIGSMSRDGAALVLEGMEGAIVPRPRAVSQAELLAGDVPAFPFLIRPATSHAGRDLARIATANELSEHLATRDPGEATFFVTPFVETRGADGLYRKYRAVFVAGEPFPVHMAIHDRWAVWYYNADMERHPARRAEEARFLARPRDVIGSSAAAALTAIGSRLGLDYVGLDFGVAPDGRLVVFEVETGMIVHDHDPVELFPYKKEAVGRIRRAFERLIDEADAALVRPIGDR